jgi:hypothetical protein
MISGKSFSTDEILEYCKYWLQKPRSFAELEDFKGRDLLLPLETQFPSEEPRQTVDAQTYKMLSK